MDEALQRAQELGQVWDEEARRILPAGADIFDAHVHLGHDIDGMVGLYDELIARMDEYDVSRGFMFCLAALGRRFGGRAGVFFDTSVWSPIDLLDFYRQVSPEQVLYASDYPYGQQPASFLITLRTARMAGLDEAQVRDVLAGNANRIAN